VSNIFRDPTEGATARRADLLRRRRDELVMMPHAIRRVFVARRARVAASLAISLLGAAMIVIAMKPAWAGWLAQGLPGINPAVLCTLVVAMWIVGVLAYLGARALDEHRFAVAMSRLVMPSADLAEDIERLTHENPDQAARDMAHRLEARSAALPVLAAGVLLPVTALYIGAAIRAGGWPPIAGFEGAVAVHATKLALCAGASTVIAIMMTKRAARLPVVAPAAAALALAGAGAAVLTTLWLVPVALVVAMVALVVRRLRIERDLLQAEDPAAGSEVFTIRGFIKQLRATVAPVVARVRSVKPIWVLVTGMLIIAGVTATKLLEQRETHPRLSDAAISKPAAPPPTTLGPTGSTSTVTITTEGVLAIQLDLADEQPLDIPALAGLKNIPTGWRADVRVTHREGPALQVSLAGGEDTVRVSAGDNASVHSKNCGIGELPPTLRVQGAPGHYKLYVFLTLTPAGC
jgi:hypothetical protein